MVRWSFGGQSEKGFLSVKCIGTGSVNVQTRYLLGLTNRRMLRYVETKVDGSCAPSRPL